MRPLLFVAPVLALLTACSTGRCPSLAPQLDYCLQPPAAAPEVVSLQEVVARKGTQSETLLVQVENDARRLAVVGVSPVGQTLVSATWDGERVKAPPVPPSLAPDPGAMLALAQFGLMAPALLRAGFGPELRMVVQDGPDGSTIDVQDGGGRTLLAIERRGHKAPFDRIRIALPTTGVELTSRALNEPTPPAAR